MSLDFSIVEEYYAAIPNAIDTSTGRDGSSWKIPCNSNPPDLGLRFGNVLSVTNNAARVPGSLMLGPPLNDGAGSKYPQPRPHSQIQQSYMNTGS